MKLAKYFLAGMLAVSLFSCSDEVLLKGEGDTDPIVKPPKPPTPPNPPAGPTVVIDSLQTS